MGNNHVESSRIETAKDRSAIATEESRREIKSMTLLVDAQNLFYSARDTYGPSARVNYERLKEVALRGKNVRVLRCVIYLTQLEDDISLFAQTLRRLSYEVKIRWIKRHEDGSISNTDSDLDIAVDCIRACETSDTLVIASGDADFIPVYQYIREKGKDIEILAFQDALNRQIKENVDKVTILDEYCIFRKRPQENGAKQAANAGIDPEKTPEKARK